MSYLYPQISARPPKHHSNSKTKASKYKVLLHKLSQKRSALILVFDAAETCHFLLSTMLFRRCTSCGRQSDVFQAFFTKSSRENGVRGREEKRKKKEAATYLSILPSKPILLRRSRGQRSITMTTRTPEIRTSKVGSCSTE